MLILNYILLLFLIFTNKRFFFFGIFLKTNIKYSVRDDIFPMCVPIYFEARHESKNFS